MLLFKNSLSVLRQYRESLVSRLKNLTPHEIFTLIFITFAVSVVTYTLSIQKRIDPTFSVFETQDNSLSMITDPTENSTAEQELEKLEVIEDRIADAETTREKLTLSVKKGLTLITQNNRTSQSSLEAQKESRRLFAGVYENTKNVPDLKTLKETALWGFLFQFVSISNGDATLILDGMPDDIKSAYFTDPAIPNGGLEAIKKVSEGMIAFVDDEELFSILRNDKGFNSYSAMLKAGYLDSFSTTLSETERINLITSIEKDILEYETGIEITSRDAVDTLRTTSIMPTQIAFARFVMKHTRDQNSTDISDIVSVYEHIDSLQDIDGFGRAFVLSRIALYELSALHRMQSSEEQISLAVTKIHAQRSKYSDISDVLTRMLNNRFSLERQWNQVNKDLVSLSKTSPSFQALLDTLGVAR